MGSRDLIPVSTFVPRPIASLSLKGIEFFLGLEGYRSRS